MACKAGGIALVGQPAGQAGNQVSGTDPLRQDVSVKEVLLHELAQRRSELVLAFDDQRGVRYRQAKRPAEQGRHREPVCDTTDHRRLSTGLNVAQEGPVDADRGDGYEKRRHRCQESRRSSASGR